MKLSRAVWRINVAKKTYLTKSPKIVLLRAVWITCNIPCRSTQSFEFYEGTNLHIVIGERSLAPHVYARGNIVFSRFVFFKVATSRNLQLGSWDSQINGRGEEKINSISRMMRIMSQCSSKLAEEFCCCSAVLTPKFLIRMLKLKQDNNLYVVYVFSK